MAKLLSREIGDSQGVIYLKLLSNHSKVYWLNIFDRWLTQEIGVTPIPPSAFYTVENKIFARNLGNTIELTS